MNRLFRRRLLIHIILWLALYAGWVLLFQNRTITLSRTMQIEFCYLFFIALNFYFNFYFNVPRFLEKKKYLLFGVMGISFTLFSAWGRAEVSYYINILFLHNGNI